MLLIEMRLDAQDCDLELRSSGVYVHHFPPPWVCPVSAKIDTCYVGGSCGYLLLLLLPWLRENSTTPADSSIGCVGIAAAGLASSVTQPGSKPPLEQLASQLSWRTDFRC